MGTYGTADVSACIYLDCVAEGNWAATADGVTASIDCDETTYGATFYSNKPQDFVPRRFGEISITPLANLPLAFSNAPLRMAMLPLLPRKPQLNFAPLLEEIT